MLVRYEMRSSRNCSADLKRKTAIQLTNSSKGRHKCELSAVELCRRCSPLFFCREQLIFTSREFRGAPLMGMEFRSTAGRGSVRW